jgi:hypothetical protein
MHFEIIQVGYSLNALVDFPPEDPIAILKHLMVGSEGTVGFISSVTYNTVREVHHKVGQAGGNSLLYICTYKHICLNCVANIPTQCKRCTTR